MAWVMITMNIFVNVVQHPSYVESMKVIVILMMNAVVAFFVAKIIVQHHFRQMLTVAKIQKVPYIIVKSLL